MGFLYSRGQPLFWLRLTLLGFVAGLVGVCVAVCVQAIRGSNHLEKTLTAQAAAMGITGFRYDFSDIRHVTDVMLVVALLFEILTAASVFALLSAYIANPPSARKAPTHRFLPAQAAGFAFLSLWLFTVLVPTTFFVRTRSAIISSDNSGPVNGAAFDASIQISYWNYGFLRCLAAAPWFSLIFALPATIATIAAWRLSRSYVSEYDNNAAMKEKNVA